MICEDIVVFDPRVINDNASFESPTTPASGIIKVLVNGKLVYPFLIYYFIVIHWL